MKKNTISELVHYAFFWNFHMKMKRLFFLNRLNSFFLPWCTGILSLNYIVDGDSILYQVLNMALFSIGENNGINS